MISALISLIALTSPLAKQPIISIIPRPVEMTLESGSFAVNSDTDVHVGRGCEEVAQRLRGYLSPGTGYEFNDGPIKDKETISLSIDPNQAHGKEGYTLDVTPNRISIVGGGAAGVFYGMETLRQLFPTETFRKAPMVSGPYQIHCLKIVDYPRFGWRGCHLDSARHFMPKDFILHFLDYMALHKLNSFHWHLTDNQGWRIQIPQYPNLVNVGSWRDKSQLTYGNPPTYDNREYGGYYTVADMKEVVAYAKQRFINVVPEFDVPAHSQALIASYPELGDTGVPSIDKKGGIDVINLEPKTVQFVKNVVSEILKIFPSKYIHLGGDEASTQYWSENPVMQAKMKELGITDPRGLQSWFTHQMADFLADHGRRMVGWDEILEGGKLTPGAIVMSWRGEQGGIDAAKSGHQVIMAPGQYTYLDHYQSRDIDLEPRAIGGLLTLHQVYSYDPIPAAMPSEDVKYVLGAQTQIWSEYVLDQLHAEYMAFPRLCAFSEVVWSPKEGKDYDDFMARLKVHLKRLQALGINYRRLDPPEPIIGKYDIGESNSFTSETVTDHSIGDETLIPGDTSSNPLPAITIGIGSLIQENQDVRIGIWPSNGSDSLNVQKVVLVVDGQAFPMVQSHRDANAYSFDLKNLPDTIPAESQLSASLVIVFKGSSGKSMKGEIQLLPDPSKYHPYFEGAR